MHIYAYTHTHDTLLYSLDLNNVFARMYISVFIYIHVHMYTNTQKNDI